MSRIAFYILLIIASSCELLEKPPYNNPSWGFLSAKLNGKEWTKKYPKGFKAIRGVVRRPQIGESCNADIYDIGVDFESKDRNICETLIFEKVPLVRGRHKILKNVYGHCDESDPLYAVFLTVIGGDVSGNTYKVLETEENFFQVDSYDPKSKEIKGAFQVTFVLDNYGSDEAMPDTLRFTEGRFHTKILRDLR